MPYYQFAGNGWLNQVEFEQPRGSSSGPATPTAHRRLQTTPTSTRNTLPPSFSSARTNFGESLSPEIDSSPATRMGGKKRTGGKSGGNSAREYDEEGVLPHGHCQTTARKNGFDLFVQATTATIMAILWTIRRREDMLTVTTEPRPWLHQRQSATNPRSLRVVPIRVETLAPSLYTQPIPASPTLCPAQFRTQWLPVPANLLSWRALAGGRKVVEVEAP